MDSFWIGELSGSIWRVSGVFSRNYPHFPGDQREDRLSANIRTVQVATKGEGESKIPKILTTWFMDDP